MVAKLPLGKEQFAKMVGKDDRRYELINSLDARRPQGAECLRPRRAGAAQPTRRLRPGRLPARARPLPREIGRTGPQVPGGVPGDLFSGKALVYRPTENGYLLYSVGVNGKDDGGRSADDEPPGDDLHVRMPLPESKAKK